MSWCTRIARSVWNAMAFLSAAPSVPVLAVYLHCSHIQITTTQNTGPSSTPSHIQYLLTCQPSSPWSKGWKCWVISTTWMWDFQYHQGNFFPLKFQETDRLLPLNFPMQSNVMQTLHGKFWLEDPKPGKFLNNWKLDLKMGNGKRL